MMPKGFNNVLVLALVNALAFSVTPMLMLVASLVGAELSPKPSFATLPIALMVIGVALGVWPATRLMQALGRKRALWLFMLLLTAACLGASYSLVYESFVLFCLCTACVGFSNAALQQLRFAAMESVAPQHNATATSTIMLSGVLAAFIGPELGVLGQHLTAVEFQGSFLMMIAVIVVAAVMLFFYQAQQSSELAEAPTNSGSLHLLKNSGFLLALASAAVAYMVMTFVMTATPISMHHHYGHSLADTKWVIQSHIAAMFLPSLLTPLWVRFIGLKGLMLAGLACYALTIVIGFTSLSVNGFWFQLVMLGIGWNALFFAGTIMLPSTYNEGEQYQAQALNDTAVFSLQAIAALGSGWAISVFSWQTILLFCLLPMSVLVFVLIFGAFKSRAS